MSLQGYVHPNFGHVAWAFRKQLKSYPEGGGALSVYHQSECVVDIWGGYKNQQGEPWQQDTLAFSFSTTKGVLSTLIHVLADQGLLDYNAPVAEYWPEFSANGKSSITIRHLLCHESGLYHIADMVDHVKRILDWEYMTEVLAKAKPIHKPGATNGYHALTYGWLLGELVQRVTKKNFTQALQDELTNKLDLDGIYIGTPNKVITRCADLVNPGYPFLKPNPLAKLSCQCLLLACMLLKVTTFDVKHLLKSLGPKGITELDLNANNLKSVPIPALNGMFTARSLAKMYAFLANQGTLNNIRLLSPNTIQKITQIQNKKIGRVVPLPLHWRLGYHRIFNYPQKLSSAFGHYGLGGSGAWADPERNLAVALTLNSGMGTPFGDLRIVKINQSVLGCTDNGICHESKELSSAAI